MRIQLLSLQQAPLHKHFKAPSSQAEVFNFIACRHTYIRLLFHVRIISVKNQNKNLHLAPGRSCCRRYALFRNPLWVWPTSPPLFRHGSAQTWPNDAYTDYPQPNKCTPLDSFAQEKENDEERWTAYTGNFFFHHLFQVATTRARKTVLFQIPSRSQRAARWSCVVSGSTTSASVWVSDKIVPLS